MKIQPLPPLNSLVAFEAAARHLSFTTAAKELHVTQGAVSQQIRQLESYLGESLFERSTREVSLTALGVRYYSTVQNVLHQIANATSDVCHWHGSRQITILTSSAIAAEWLLPKVADFQNGHEEIDLRIIASDQIKDVTRLDCDLALYYFRAPPGSVEVIPLFSEEVFPVCSPSYLQKHPHISDIARLHEATWLWLDDPHRDWIGWPEWLDRVGAESCSPKRRVNINSYSMLIQSAINGHGIALAWANLMSDNLKTGALVRPTPTSVRTDAKFCMLKPQAMANNRVIVEAFADWLQSQSET